MANDEIVRVNGRPVPFRLRAAPVAVPTGYPPDVNPNEIITASHINAIRTSVYAWPGDVDGQSHNLSNVHLINATGVMVDPTTTAGDLIVRDATAPARLPAGTNGQVLIVDTALPAKLKWGTPPPAVPSVFGRSGAIVAQVGDYTVGQVTGAAADVTTAKGDLIVRGAAVLGRLAAGTDGQVLTADATRAEGLRWSAAGVPSVFGRSGAIVAQTGDYTAAQVTGAVNQSVLYDDPAWLRTLAWSKLTSAPSTFPPTAHTHPAADIISGRFDTARLGAGIADATVYLRGDGAWAPVVGSGGGGSVTSVFGRAGVVIAQTGDYSAAMVSGAVVDPTIALGDLMVRGGSAVIRLPAGANGQLLQSDSTAPGGLKWLTPGGGFAIPNGLTNGDTLQWLSGAWAVLPVGTVGQVLTVDTGGVGLKWGEDVTGGGQTPWLQDIDGGNHALTNVQTIVSNGAIRSTSGGFVFPDGSTMATALRQTPWTQPIDAASFDLSNVRRMGIGRAADTAIPIVIQSANAGGGGIRHTDTSTTGAAGFVATNSSGSSGGFLMPGSAYTTTAWQSAGVMYTSAANDVVVAPNQTERMRIFAATGAARFAAGVQITSGQSYAANLYYDGSNWRYIANGSGFALNAISGESDLFTATSGTAGAVASLVKRTVWKDDGSMAVTGPITLGNAPNLPANMPLQLNADSGSAAMIGLHKGATYGGQVGYANGDSQLGTGLLLRVINTDPIRFLVGGENEAMRINTSGSVGIGTASPGTPLEVVGANGISVRQSAGGGGLGITFNDAKAAALITSYWSSSGWRPVYIAGTDAGALYAMNALQDGAVVIG